MKNSKLVKKGLGLIVVLLVVKLFGFLKQSIIAWKFGTSADLDAFVVADGYINMFGQILLTAVPPAIVTLYLKRHYENERNDFISSSVIFLAVSGIVLVLLNIILSPVLAGLFGNSFDDLHKQQLSSFIRILSPLIIFACIASVSSGLLQSKNRFIPEKMLGLFLSTSIIICTIFVSPYLGIYSLSIGFVVGYLVYFIMMLILLIKNASFRLQNPFKNNTFRRFLKNVFPIIIGICIVDTSHLIDRIIASSLESGSVSSLYYSQLLSGDLINSVIIVSMGVLLLPKLSIDVQTKTKTELLKSIRNVFNIASPIIVLFTAIYLVSGEKIVSIIFQRGEFVQSSTAMVYSCVIGYSIGFVFMLIKEILVRYFYALENTKTPMFANIIGILINIVLSLFLSAKIGVSGIALATSISYFISDIVLLCKIGFKNLKSVFNDKHHSLWELLKNSIIILAVVIIGFLIQHVLNSSIIISLIISLMSMILVFIGLSYIFKTDLGAFAFNTILNKINKKKVLSKKS